MALDEGKCGEGERKDGFDEMRGEECGKWKGKDE